MRRTTGIGKAMLLAMLYGVAPLHAQEPQGEPRELIYCADQMTHEEREAYRAKIRAAHSIEGKAAVRQAHQQEMQARTKQSGKDGACEPPRLRQRERRGQ